MIHIELTSPPDDFSEQVERWQQEWEDTHSEKSPSEFWALIRQRKAMQEFAVQLKKTFYQKCAYCESTVEHVASLHIEHYFPKSNAMYKNLTFVWENWLIACPVCNQNKGARFPLCNDEPCLLNPTVDRPENHVDFIAAQIIGLTERGGKTIDLVKLDRVRLDEMRSRWLMSIDQLLILICKAEEVKDEIRTILIWAMQPNAPYSAMTKAYLARKTPKLASPKTPHEFVKGRALLKISELLIKYKEQLREFE
jgi:uncharacterized protein (TIGR02646 family)